MKNKKTTKNAWITSLLIMALCMAMLIGSTFAWFTDTAATGINKITAGNLDIQLEYASEFNDDGTVKTWTVVTESTHIFSDLENDGETENLWEPGHTEIAYLRISNLGSLALNYSLGINVSEEVKGTNQDGDEFALSDYLVFAQQVTHAEVTKFENREAAWTAAGETLGFADYTNEQVLLPAEKADNTDTFACEYITLVVYMPTSVGNIANHKTDTTAPSITFGIQVDATQTPYESDSFNDQYDANAG